MGSAYRQSSLAVSQSGGGLLDSRSTCTTNGMVRAGTGAAGRTLDSAQEAAEFVTVHGGHVQDVHLCWGRNGYRRL